MNLHIPKSKKLKTMTNTTTIIEEEREGEEQTQPNDNNNSIVLSPSDYATIMYIKLLSSIYHYKDSRLGCIILDWIESGLCKQHFVENDRSGEDYDEDEEEGEEQPPKKKIKKQKKFFTNQICLEYNEHVAYTIFKTVILLKPSLSIIGTDIHLFNNKDVGIRLHHLLESGRYYYYELYKNRNSIFDNPLYPFGIHILSNAHLNISRINIEFRHKLLRVFHMNYMKEAEQAFSDFLDEMKRMKTPVKKNLYKPIYYRYLEKYSEEIMKLIIELNSNVMKLGVYEDERDAIEKILIAFNSSIRKGMLNIPKKYTERD